MFGSEERSLTRCALKSVGFLKVNTTVLLRCLIDRGCVKSDTLFCSLFGDLPHHVSSVLRSRTSIQISGKHRGDNTPLRWWDSCLHRSKVTSRGHTGIQVGALDERQGPLVSRMQEKKKKRFCIGSSALIKTEISLQRQDGLHYILYIFPRR